MDDRHLEDGEVGEGELFVACRDAPTLLEPGDAALDSIAQAVGRPIEDSTSAPYAVLIRSLRDHGLDLSPMKPVPHVTVAVSLVPGQATRATSRASGGARNPYRFHERSKQLRFVSLTRADLHGQR